MAVVASGGALLAGSLLLGAHVDAVWELYLVIGVLAALGMSAAGRLFDATGSYALALPIAAGMALLAPGLLWFVAPRHPNPPPRR